MKILYIYTNKLVLFLVLASFALIESIDLEPGITSFKLLEKKNYSILNEPIGEQKYLSLIIIGDDEEVNYVVSVYDDNSKRIQVGQSIQGATKLYLSLNHFINKKIDFTLECSDYLCSGQIEYKFSRYIELEEGEPFSYYVTEDNTIMEFLLNSIFPVSNIWARGQLKFPKKPELSEVLNYYEKKENENYYYIVDELMNNAIFTVYGNVGDYINVGYIGYLDNISKLRLDGPIVVGFLKKTILEKVCYKIDNIIDDNEGYIFGTGIILTKIAYSYIGDSLENKIQSEIFSSGNIKVSLSQKEINDQSACITFPNEIEFPQYKEIEEIIYIYQLTTGKTNKNNFNLYEQINGAIYPRIILDKSKSAFSIQQRADFEKMKINLITYKGTPKMTLINCDNYPLCPLEDDIIKNGITPQIINKNGYLTYAKEADIDYSPINEKQKIIVIECDNSNLDYSEVCDFGILMYKDNDEIEIFEDKPFCQFSHKEHVDNYVIKKSNETINKVIIEITSFTGEIEVIKTNFQNEQYTEINKAFSRIDIELDSKINEDLKLSIKALSNAYYTILTYYLINDDENSLITRKIQPGLTYFITFDINEYTEQTIRFIKFENYFKNVPMMVFFYTLNYKIGVDRVIRGNNEVIDNYPQIAYDITDPNETENKYNKYMILLLDNLSKEEEKKYKIYISAIELSTNHEDNIRDIIIPDNAPQQIVFGKKNSHISYGYIQNNLESDILIIFNPIHIAQYKIKIFFNNKKRDEEETIVANDAIIINYEEWADICNEKNTICYIQLDITLEKIKDTENPLLEFSIRSLESNSIAYLSKNFLKIDYIQNNIPQQYYTELRKEERGFITINFMQGSGIFYAKILHENNLDETSNFLEMDRSTKKIDFKTDKNCKSDCFLFIQVVSEIENNEIYIKRNYPYSIMVHTFPDERSYNEEEVMSIPTDEYILGTVYLNKFFNIFEFYSVWIKSDAEKISIDFQSTLASIYINIGEEKPRIGEKTDFKFLYNRKDRIISISKDDILKKENSKKDLKDVILTLGIWTNLAEESNPELYSFIVRLENCTDYDIYRVNSERKALCNTKKTNNNIFRCVYAIEYNYISNFNYLLVYANEQKQSTSINIYANYIDQKDYEIESKDKLKSLIPTKENNHFSNDELNSDYLIMKDGLKKNNYLLVSVETKLETTIELMSSIYLFYDNIFINPRTPYLLRSKPNEILTLIFTSNSKNLIHLKGIAGNAIIYWSSEPQNRYYLRGRNDRLSITTKQDDIELKIESINNEDSNIGFIFWVYYEISNFIFDQLLLDESSNYIYTEDNLPIIYYSFLNISNDTYYEIVYSFNVQENEAKIDSAYYDINPFDLVSLIVSESSIQQAKYNNEISVENGPIIGGVYDLALKTGLIRISKIDIQLESLSESPYYYLKFQKNENFIEKRVYKGIELEMNCVNNNNNFTVSELVNQFGTIDVGEKERKYKLRTDTSFKYLNIKFSCIGESLSINVEGCKNQLKFEKEQFGRKIYSLKIDEDKSYIFLVIKRKNDTIDASYYYTFKYSHSNNAFLDEYSIPNTNLYIKKNNKSSTTTYNVEINPVDNYQKYHITYILRGIHSLGNNEPTKPEIILRNDIQIAKEFYNPSVDQTTKKINLNLEIKDSSYGLKYMQVIAQIQNEGNIEYLSYDFINIESLKYEENNDSKPTKLILIITFGIILLIIIIILAIVIYSCNKKNKDLIDKINKVSFQLDRETLGVNGQNPNNGPIISENLLL